MGNSDSKPQQKEFLQGFQNSYQFIQDHDDSRMGKIAIFKGAGNLVAVKKSYTHNKEDLEKYMENGLKPSLSTLGNCQYLLKLFAYEEVDDQAMCGSMSELKVYVEYHLNNLEAEIQQRNRNLMYYSEQELLVILYSILQASSFLEQFDKTLNDIRPQNIYLTKTGQLRLLPFGSLADDVPIYTKVLSQRYPYYISPEQLGELRENKVKSTQNAFKADSFSIGITMLQAASLQSGIECYDINNLQLNQSNLSSLQQISGQKYSQFLNRLINVLLLEDPQKRPQPSQVLSILKPYEEAILNLQPFEVNEEFVRQSVQQSTTGPTQIIPQTQSFVQFGSQSLPPNYQIIQSQVPQQYQVIQQDSPVKVVQQQVPIQFQQGFQQSFVSQQQVPIQSQVPIEYVKQSTQQQPTNIVYVQQQQQQPGEEQSQVTNAIRQTIHQQQIPNQTVQNIPITQQRTFTTQNQPISPQVKETFQVVQQPQYIQPQVISQQEYSSIQSPIRLIQGPSQQNLTQQQFQQVTNFTPQKQVQYADQNQPQPVYQNQGQPVYQNQGQPVFQSQGQPVVIRQAVHQEQIPQGYQQIYQHPNQIQTQFTQKQYVVQPQIQQQQTIRYEDNNASQQSGRSGNMELSEIDKRINDVLQKTQYTLNKVEHSNTQNMF